MSSQTDLDQGGTFRQTQKVYLGPSVGWVAAPSQNMLELVGAQSGTVNLARGMNLVTVNYNGTTSVRLPDCRASAAGAQAIPGQFVIAPVTIVEVGGFASAANPVLIAPQAGKNIDGLASITIEQPYGAYVLKPNLSTGNWTLTQ